MRPTSLAVCLACAVFACLATRGMAPAADPTVTPFWQAPKADLDLRSLSPAPMTLVAGPDPSRKFALLRPDASANFVPDAPVLVPLVADVDTGYRVITGGLKEGALPYGDRKFKFQKLDAALSGLTLLQTKMGNKSIVDGRYSIILSAAKPCYVFVAVDERALEIYKKHGAPSWLQEYAPTGHTIATDDPIMAGWTPPASYQVFVRKAPAGRIVLGPPCMDVDNGMYFAFFAEAK